MARAHSLYVVMDVVRAVPVRGFTVKHELVGWLIRQETYASMMQIAIYQMPDGARPRDYSASNKLDHVGLARAWLAANPSHPVPAPLAYF